MIDKYEETCRPIIVRFTVLKANVTVDYFKVLFRAFDRGFIPSSLLYVCNLTYLQWSVWGLSEGKLGWQTTQKMSKFLKDLKPNHDNCRTVNLIDVGTVLDILSLDKKVGWSNGVEDVEILGLGVPFFRMLISSGVILPFLLNVL